VDASISKSSEGEIARQESPKCQRIWRHEDAFTVLKGTTVSSSIFLYVYLNGLWCLDIFFHLLSFLMYF